MVKTLSNISYWSLALCAAVMTSSGILAATPSTAPQPMAEVDAQAKARLDQLLRHESLRLTHDGAGSFERFAFRLTVVVPAKDGSRHSSTFLVARDKSNVAMLVLGPNGRPFAFARDGLFAGFSPTAPGRLIVCARGAPAILIEGDEANGDFKIDLSFSGRAERSKVAVDLGSVIRTAATKLLRARYDENTNALNLATPNSEIWLPLDGEDVRAERFPISGLLLRSRTGFSITVSELGTEIRWPELLTLEKADVERLGLPMHVLGEKEALRVPMFVPPPFGRNDKEREASDSFRRLFPSVPGIQPAPATREGRDPATAPAPRERKAPAGQQVEGVPTPPTTTVQGDAHRRSTDKEFSCATG